MLADKTFHYSYSQIDEHKPAEFCSLALKNSLRLDQVLGRLGAKVAKLLRGKYKPNFTPHVDCGDNVIIINADKVKLTGNKWNDKVYLSYTGYPGGQREITPARLQAKPNGDDKLLRKVVKGMLPKNKLGAKLLGNMYVYAGSEHKHDAQNPKMIDINVLK